MRINNSNLKNHINFISWSNKKIEILCYIERWEGNRREKNIIMAMDAIHRIEK